MNKTTLWLAGDSLVQGYMPEEFTGGWGDYIGYFLDPSKFRTENRAKGGRSTRYYINEGRFYEYADSMKKGDFLFIQFCHNDDCTKEYKTMPHRLTPLGEPDKNGRFPVTPGKLVSTDFLPYEYIEALCGDTVRTKAEKEADFSEVSRIYKELFDREYYPYSADGSNGTYKWFLKYFCDEARKRGVIPIIVTAPPRMVFDGEKIKDGAALHGGNNFAYIRAALQLAEEEDVFVIDLFGKCRELFEKLGEDKTRMLNTVKEGRLCGKWPEDYDRAVADADTKFDNTHFNKFGAFCAAAMISQELIGLCGRTNSHGESLDVFSGSVYREPSLRVPAPKGLDNLGLFGV